MVFDRFLQIFLFFSTRSFIFLVLLFQKKVLFLLFYLFDCAGDNFGEVLYQLLIVAEIFHRKFQRFFIDFQFLFKLQQERCQPFEGARIQLLRHIFDGQDGLSLIVDLEVDFFSVGLEECGENFILEENDGKRQILEGILMWVQLTQDSTQVQISISQYFGLVDLQLQQQAWMRKEKAVLTLFFFCCCKLLQVVDLRVNEFLATSSAFLRQSRLLINFSFCNSTIAGKLRSQHNFLDALSNQGVNVISIFLDAALDRR